MAGPGTPGQLVAGRRAPRHRQSQGKDTPVKTPFRPLLSGRLQASRRFEPANLDVSHPKEWARQGSVIAPIERESATVTM